MPRNFGLSHVIPRESSRAQLPGLRARLLYSVKAAFQRLYDRLSQAHGAASAVHVQCIYMGRVIFHVGECRTYAHSSSAQVRGSK
jgi:hypothetical protein